MADSDLIDAKLESLARCVKRIRRHRPDTAEKLVADYDAQDIISINLQRAVQLCVDIGSHIISSQGWQTPAVMADTFTELANHDVIDADLADSLRRAVGFRNISVHQYEDVDWSRVHSIVWNDVEVFRAFAARVSGYV